MKNQHDIKRTLRRLLPLVCSLVATSAFGAELIFPGIHPKVSAGAGQTTSRGSSALFYNPANLIFSKFIEPYLDVSIAQVSYVYQHVDSDQYDPVVVNVTAPPVTAGLSMRPIPNLAFGIAILPTGTGAEQQVQSVPLEITPGSYELCDITTANEGMKVAIGAAFRVGHPFTVGLGLIRSSEKNAILVYREGEEEPFLDALYGGAHNQFIGGVRSELFERKIVAALSYKTPVTKTYQGDVLLDLGEEDTDYVPYEGAGFVPGALGFGVEGRFGIFGAFFDLLLEQWSAGRTIAKRGLGSDAAEVDYVDTMNIVLGGKLWLGKKHMLEGAFGMYPANIGDGTEVDSGTTLVQDEDDGRIGGVSFGNLEAVPRNIISGGYRYKLKGTGYLEGGLQYQTGAREVPEGFSQHGSYSISVLLISAGIAFGF